MHSQAGVVPEPIRLAFGMDFSTSTIAAVTGLRRLHHGKAVSYIPPNWTVVHACKHTHVSRANTQTLLHTLVALT